MAGDERFRYYVFGDPYHPYALMRFDRQVLWPARYDRDAKAFVPYSQEMFDDGFRAFTGQDTDATLVTIEYAAKVVSRFLGGDMTAADALSLLEEAESGPPVFPHQNDGENDGEAGAAGRPH